MQYVEVGKYYRIQISNYRIDNGVMDIDVIFQIETVTTNPHLDYLDPRPWFTIKVIKANALPTTLFRRHHVFGDINFDYAMFHAKPYSWSETVINREVEDFVKGE